ncbi:MAG: tyrosine-type recombinase/integrase [Synergistaceae bacterium]|jgi:integrase|nr:tyrosine-type recombinase/integrase [Synergistaceae bacterium]
MEVEPIRDRQKIDEMKKKLKADNPRDEALFTMGINMALRISDLLSLTVGDVMGADGLLMEAVEMQDKKGNTRHFPLNQSVRSCLESYLFQRRNLKSSDPLFPSQQGDGLASISRWQARKILHAAGKSIGLNRIGTNSLRKTFAYHVYKESGGDIGLVQKLLHQSCAESTLKYIGIGPDQVIKDINPLEVNL